jgi:membrane-bound lytic murein transglycosylase D
MAHSVVKRKPISNCEFSFLRHFSSSSNERKSSVFKERVSKCVHLAVLLQVLLVAVAPTVQAKTKTILSKPVAIYPLQCDETFSCPQSLMPRVGFWVEVFSRWDTDTAIFHDKQNPHRVYSTLQRNEGCRRSRKGDSIDKERKRLKSKLKSLAAKLESGSSLSDSQTRLYSSFDGASFTEVRAAAGRVRCQSGNKNRMREALTQFQTYRPTILDALESQNLTPELQYLPFVESAFNPNALSHVGAAGLWQIMPSTGRSLGLTVDNKVDERYDPKAATYAASRYFRDSVDKLSEAAFENGSTVLAKDLNPFVITSYNYGVRGMERAIKQVGLDYERLLLEYKSPSFQTAVKNFYASFLAARYVAKNSEQFFGAIDADYSKRLNAFNVVKLNRATSAKRIANELSIDKDKLKQFNPSLKSIIWKHKALIPKGFKLKLPYREQGWNEGFVKLSAMPVEIEKSGYSWHRVRKGQTACGIAEKYNASCSALRKLNKLNRNATIYIGKRLKVPTRTGGISVAKTTRKASSTNASNVATSIGSSPSPTLLNPTVPSFKRYKVKRGDSSCLIAERFKMRCTEFLAVNGLKRNSVIQVGQRVRVSDMDSWHVVKRGQTACGIASAHKVKCAALLDANKLRLSSTIKVGQRLRIPITL